MNKQTLQATQLYKKQVAANGMQCRNLLATVALDRIVTIQRSLLWSSNPW